MKSLIKALLLFYFVSFAPSAEAAAALWQIAASNQISAEAKSTSAVQQLYQQGVVVNLDRSQLQTLKVGHSILLPVGKFSAEAVVKRVQVHQNGSQTWFAAIADGKDSLPVVITVSDKSFFISMVTPQGTYIVNGLNSQGRLVEESVLDSVIDHSKNDFLVPQDLPAIQQQQKSSSESEAISPTVSMADEIVRVDILVVYSTGANTLYNGDAQTRINHLIAVSNQIYTDSGVFIQINALAMDEVNYPDSFNSETGLRDITSGSHSALTGVANRRAAIGADMVVFFRPYAGDNTCGIAWVNGNNGTVANSSGGMYSHTSINCADYVNAHEMGHNMGLWHSRRQDGSGNVFSYALGYGVDSNFVTVMAYPSAFTNADKIYKFSSPTLDCNGQPCGIDKNDANNGADAVTALNAVRNELAAFFVAVDIDSDGDGVLDADDAFPLDPNETVDTDGDGIGNNADTDDDNDGVLDTADAFPLDATESVDTDTDGVGNNADTDDDNDGVLDTADAFPLDATESVDTDTDGIGNNADTDDDNDGVLDTADAFPLDATESVDTDTDGIGNNADTDDDNDGVLDTADAFPLDATESVDTDTDGIGNNADTDDDNDGVLDTADVFPLDATESVDTDSDGIGNNADLDDDNDGISDEVELASGTNPLDNKDFPSGLMPWLKLLLPDSQTVPRQ